MKKSPVCRRTRLAAKIAAAVAEGNSKPALSELASVKPQVDAFFRQRDGDG